MNFKRCFLFLACLLALSGCHTIYFEKGTDRVIVTQVQSWHHGGGILGLYEYSSPYDPSVACESKAWKAVRIEQDAKSAVLSFAIPLGLYTPWIASTRCFD